MFAVRPINNLKCLITFYLLAVTLLHSFGCGKIYFTAPACDKVNIIDFTAQYSVKRLCEFLRLINFKFRKNFNEAILKMQEQGILHRLKDKWWKEMNGGGKCQTDKSSADEAAAELGLDNVGGVFVVLTVGVVTSLLFATFEFLWLVKKIAIKEHIPLKEAFLMEITFAFNIWDRQKKVKKYQSTEEMHEGEREVRF